MPLAQADIILIKYGLSNRQNLINGQHRGRMLASQSRVRKFKSLGKAYLIKFVWRKALNPNSVVIGSWDFN